MNLIEWAWMPFRRSDGSVVLGSPCCIGEPDIVELALPRADFQGAAWQFLIGLLQTAHSPKNIDDWQRGWLEPPSAESLRESFAPFSESFRLLGESPLFMQDHDPLAEERVAPVSSLLIEAPGAQGLKHNTDHFIKRGIADAMCASCAAMALYTMQINAPAGGKGYRTGLRGGGPLTTLVLPPSDDTCLWRKLWCNVIPRTVFSFEPPLPNDSRIFPWLAPTQVSERAGSEVMPEQVHALQAYWSMPRRFRLIADDEGGGCDVCGEQAQSLISGVRTTNYGINYGGHWKHPLTPYRVDPKKPEQPPLSLKGQQGGLGYRHWESLVLGDEKESGDLPAEVVEDFHQTKREALEDLDPYSPTARHPRLWVFGYDMDNMKARGWHSTTMPLLAIADAEQRSQLLDWLRRLVGTAEKAAWQLRSAVKAAWFSRPGDARGDFSFIDERFWEATEPVFYACLQELGVALDGASPGLLPANVAQRWLTAIQREAGQIFDELALSGDAEVLDMKRISAARNGLLRRLHGSKEIKELRRLAQVEAA